MLCKFGKKGSENCSFFMNEPETSNNLFHTCTKPSRLCFVHNYV